MYAIYSRQYIFYKRRFKKYKEAFSFLTRLNQNDDGFPIGIYDIETNALTLSESYKYFGINDKKIEELKEKILSRLKLKVLSTI